MWLDGGELQKLLAKVKEYRHEYYEDERYRTWEAEYTNKKKKRGLFDFFEELFD